MAESGKEGKFWKGVTKFSVRAKQKVLEKMQKAERTKDDVYEEFVVNFRKQETGANKLKNEMVKYLNNLKFMAQSTKSLLETFRELYEPEWAGNKEYGTTTNQMILLWDDVVAKMNSGVNEPLEMYMSKFPDLRQKVAKQSRKQTDYDAAKRKLEEIRAQGKDPRKAEESYSEAKQIYDELTDELYSELPSFYDSRVKFYATVFHAMASSSLHFHQEIAKVDEQWSSGMEKLLDEAKVNVRTSKRDRPVDSSGCTLRSRPSDEGQRGDLSDSFTNRMSNSNEHTPEKPEAQPNSTSKLDASTENEEDSMVTPPTTPGTSSSAVIDAKPPGNDASVTVPPESVSEGTEESDESNAKAVTSETNTPAKSDTKPASAAASEKPVEDNADKSPAAEESSPKTAQKVPPPKPPPLEEEETTGVLYKVLATHNYVGQDEDELSFQKGDLVLVLPFEDPEDQDEGWQLGKIQGTDHVGVFPENFTKKL